MYHISAQVFPTIKIAGMSRKSIDFKKKTTGSKIQIKLTCSGHCCRATHNGTNAVVGNALVVTRKGRVKRQNGQSPLMNLNLFRVSVQSFPIMQPWDAGSNRFSRTIQDHRSTKLLDSREWLRNKIRRQVCKGTFQGARKEEEGGEREGALNTFHLHL